MATAITYLVGKLIIIYRQNISVDLSSVYICYFPCSVLGILCLSLGSPWTSNRKLMPN